MIDTSARIFSSSTKNYLARPIAVCRFYRSIGAERSTNILFRNSRTRYMARGDNRMVYNETEKTFKN